MAVSLGYWTFQDNVVVSSSSSKWPFFMDILTLKEEMTRLYQYIQSPSDALPHSRGMDASYHKVIRSSVVTDFTSAVFVSLLTLPMLCHVRVIGIQVVYFSVQTILFTISTWRLETMGQMVNDWYMLWYLEQFVSNVTGFWIWRGMCSTVTDG
jgi:hypothetical protein